MNDLVCSDWKFHHIGYATTSIHAELRQFEYLGYRMEGEMFVDPQQGITGCFLIGTGPRVELLENLPGSDTLTPWINAGIKLYHTAYVVPKIDEALSYLKQHRARIVVEPVRAVAFGDREIAFAMLRNKLLVELIQQ